MHKSLEIEELLYSSDGPTDLEKGTVDELFAVVNHQQHIGDALDALATFRPGKPLMVGEFWTGWFDHFGAPHNVWDYSKYLQQFTEILKRNASFNLYMFIGGTNFGFMNGANRVPKPGKPLYLPIIASYDYDALLTEFGNETSKYCRNSKIITNIAQGTYRQKKLFKFKDLIVIFNKYSYK